jgi:hypothetical protein
MIGFSRRRPEDFFVDDFGLLSTNAAKGIMRTSPPPAVQTFITTIV